MTVYEGQTFADVYSWVLKEIYKNPDFKCKPRDQMIHEDTNVSLVIHDPLSSFYLNERRSSQFKYILAELCWYFSGRNDTQWISKFSKFWNQIQNPDGTANSAYGFLLFNDPNDHGISEWEWALESLKKDQDSRQATIQFNKPQHKWWGNKDFVCTLNGIFHIRDNKLDFTIDMRSNDLILGLPMDIPFFTLLQWQMLQHLNIDRKIPIEMGKYTHIAHSLHIYERNFELVEEMLKYKFEPLSCPSDLLVDWINPNGSPTNHTKMHTDNVEIDTVRLTPSGLEWQIYLQKEV